MSIASSRSQDSLGYLSTRNGDLTDGLVNLNERSRTWHVTWLRDTAPVQFEQI